MKSIVTVKRPDWGIAEPGDHDSFIGLVVVFQGILEQVVDQRPEQAAAGGDRAQILDPDRTRIEAVDGALAVYARALEEGAEKYLVGRPSQIVYRRFNQPDQHETVVHPADASIYRATSKTPS